MINPDPQKLQKYIGKIFNDMGAAASGALVVLGDRSGLFRAVAKHSPAGADVKTIATSAGLDERYVQEWLSCMAASHYVEYLAKENSFSMTPEQCAVFADSDSPVALGGGYYSVAALYLDEPKVAEAFRSGAGVSWDDHHSCLFCGTERFFRPGYSAHLLQEWLPALEAVTAKLERGAQVADVGCGHGCSTTIMAKAFPKSEFIGFDVHPASVDRARKLAEEEKLSNVRFEIATAKEFPGSEYDLVTFFDCLHDMGDPVGAAKHVRESLAEDGTWLLVEPNAGDTLRDNLNPIGRLYYAFSTMVCTPASKSQEVGLALGAQAGERRLREVVCGGAGFGRFRRAAETPFNLILEVRS
jgi:SAM-dependent methyltransferase